MKKVVLYFFVSVLLAPCFKVVAQEKNDLSSSLMFLYSPLDGSGKVLSETTSIGKNHVGYAYAELTGLCGGGAEAYGQFFWEQKFWDKPIFIHAEYRGTVANSFYESLISSEKLMMLSIIWLPHPHPPSLEWELHSVASSF